MMSKCTSCFDKGFLPCPLYQKTTYCSNNCGDFDWLFFINLNAKQNYPREMYQNLKFSIKDHQGKEYLIFEKLARDRYSGLLYAMKIIEKPDISIQNLRLAFKQKKTSCESVI